MEILVFIVVLVTIFIVYKSARRSKTGIVRKGSVNGKDIEFRVSTSSGRVTTYVSNALDDDHEFDFPDDDYLPYLESQRSLSKNKNAAVWIEPGQVVKIGRHKISGGFFYFGGVMPETRPVAPLYEASLVDKTLKIRSSSPNFEDGSLGYWPWYGKLSQKARDSYLTFLGSTRTSQDTPLGYVFLYFYGLERRLLIDVQAGLVDKAEAIALINEVIRLRRIYASNRSFDRYSLQLLGFVAITNPEISPPKDVLRRGGKRSFLLSYMAGCAVKDGKPISAELALPWVKSLDSYNLKTPARRCSKEFELLFQHYFKVAHPKGFVVKPNRTKMQHYANLASPSLRNYSTPGRKNLPDPLQLVGPGKKLIEIAEQATKDLESYSRYVGKAGNEATDVATMLRLPSVLRNKKLMPALEEASQWLTGLEEEYPVIALADLFEKSGMDVPKKLLKSDIEMIELLTCTLGYGYAPDPALHGTKPDLNSVISLYRANPPLLGTPSKAFREVGMALRIGAMVAAADGVVDKLEKDALITLVQNDEALTRVEKLSLIAYLHYRINTPPSMSGMKARLSNLGSQEKHAISHIMVSVALADGAVKPDEVKKLEKLYTALGLDKAMVVQDVHEMSTSGTTTGRGTTERDIAPLVALDQEVVKLHESDTQEVQSMLATIFDEDSEVEDDLKGADDTAGKELEQSDNAFPGLDASHAALYGELLTKDEWQMAQFEVLCKAHGLMTNGAVEVINDWAYDNVEAAVLEEDDNILVNQEIAEELGAL